MVVLNRIVPDVFAILFLLVKLTTVVTTYNIVVRSIDSQLMLSQLRTDQ